MHGSHQSKLNTSSQAQQYNLNPHHRAPGAEKRDDEERQESP